MHLNRKLLGLKSFDIEMCRSCILGEHRSVNLKKVGRTPKKSKI